MPLFSEWFDRHNVLKDRFVRFVRYFRYSRSVLKYIAFLFCTLDIRPFFTCVFQFLFVLPQLRTTYVSFNTQLPQLFREVPPNFA